MFEILRNILIVWTFFGFTIFLWVELGDISCINNSTKWLIRYCLGPLNIIYLLIPLIRGIIHFITTIIHGCYICNRSPALYFIYTRNPFMVPIVKKRLRSKKYSNTVWTGHYKLFARKISFGSETNRFLSDLKHKNTDDKVVLYV